MKRAWVVLLGAVTAVVFTAWLSHSARGDDETGDVEIKIAATLDAVDCTATPPTVSVLGLTIDLSNAANEGDSESTEGDTGDGTGDGSGDDGGGDSNGGCAALQVGQSVEVKLASDVPDPTTGHLVATEVEQGGDGEAAIQAPLQGVDSTGQTITLLGLMVDVSHASFDGADDNSEDGSSQAIDLSQLMVGQSVEVKLDASQLPALVATELEVKNFANQVEVELDDENGEVDDGEDDVDIEVDETVVVQNPTAAAAAPRRVKQVIHFRMSTSGSFVLPGLPTGRAKITATRVAGGLTKVGHRRVRVRGNMTRSVRLRLRPVRAM